MVPIWVLLCLIAAALIAAGLYTERPARSTKTDASLLQEAQRSIASRRGITTPTFTRQPGQTVTQQLAQQLFQIPLDQFLFGVAVCVYLLVMLIGLDRFPIYFFTDEAVNTMLASDFLRDGFHDYEGQFFPVFFKNYDKYNLSTSVYLQVLPAALFERSVFVTRGIAALATFQAAVFIALMLKRVYRVSGWWSAPLLLAATPAWMLHARTAFETTLMASFFAGALYFYLRYRTGFLRNLFGAVLFGALAFYTYSPARVIVPVSALLLFVIDFRYHWQHKQILLTGVFFAVVCALPFLMFYLSHPGANFDQLYNQSSYWFTSEPLSAKIGQYLRTYAQGLNPLYWYFPGDHDLARHRFDGLGHLWLPALPLLLAGLYYSARRVRQPEHRVLWLVLLVIPTGAALLEIGITRLLALIIPVVILQGFGLALLIDWIAKTWRQPRLSAGMICAVLCLITSGLLASALLNAPTWSADYGLTGMQWGARQVFAAIERQLQAQPDLNVVLSPTWANGTDTLARYFMPQDPPAVTLASIDHYLSTNAVNLESILFVLPEYEFNRAMSSGKFQFPQVINVLNYPNGHPGFYFTYLKYVPEINSILAAEQQERLRPETKLVNIDGQQVEVTYPRLDIGDIQMAFDGDPRSLCRTMAANPAVFDLKFPQPRRIEGLALVFGSTQIEVTVSASAPAGPERFYRFRLGGSVDHPQGDFTFPEPVTTSQLHIEILDMQQGQPGNVHFWEITFD